MVVSTLALAVACSPNGKPTAPPAHEPVTQHDSGTSGLDSANAPSPPPLRVLSVNVGNLDELYGGPCPSDPYRGGLCSVAQEAVLRANIDSLAPDIAVIMEVIDADHCAESTWEGDPDRVCTGAPDREPYQQIRRLVGDGYTITCDGIDHRDCIAVRSDRIALVECPDGDECLGASDTPAHPPECATNGGITSVSRVHATWNAVEGPLVAEPEFTIIAAHPVNATQAEDDPCRLAQYRQAFETLPGDGPTLLAGDWNMDPYRAADLFPSGAYWHTVVGPEHRFVAHSVTEDPPLPTWMDVATLDYVLSDFLTGDCVVLGVSPDSERIDGALETMDHRAVSCALRLPE